MMDAIQKNKNEYTFRINKVIDYIESNLEKELSLDELAKVACFSKYHFHRIFHALINESLFTFIQRLRNEKAANLLIANRETPITQIALDCGFSTSQAFARSFKERFGMSATQWRKTRTSVYHRERGLDSRDTALDKTAPQSLSTKEILPVNRVTVENIPSQSLAYVRYIGAYEGDAKLFERLYGTLFKWAMPRDLFDADTKCMVVYHDSIDITDVEKLRISACISVPDKTPVKGEIGKMILEKGKYAVARFKLSNTDYYQAWNWVFSSWLPSSGYQPDDRPSFESYPFSQKESHAKDGKITVDICVPVKPL